MMASCGRRRVAEGRPLHSRIHSTMMRLLASVFLLGSVAMPVAAQRRGTPERPSQLQVVELKQSDGQILSYRYLAASTEVIMRGTPRATGAHIKLKVGSRPGFVELDINRGQITGLKPANQFGMDFLTYVLWAVSVDGKAANLGEITFQDDKPISINVTTPYQTFWLMLTAEPSYAVVDPSPVVVLYSASENPGRVLAEKIPGSLFFYTHYGDYDNSPMSSDRAPNALQQARKAVELASKSGILATGSAGATEAEGKRTRDALKQAQEFLVKAENAYKENPNGSDVAQFSRTAAQIAENARALALGAVGGALVSHLETEVARLKAELARRDAEARQARQAQAELSRASADLVPRPPEPVSMPQVIPMEPAPAETVTSFISRPFTWFCVTGWGLALLLLFRRRSI
jgi:hypothetical protein